MEYGKAVSVEILLFHFAGASQEAASAVAAAGSASVAVAGEEGLVAAASEAAAVAVQSPSGSVAVKSAEVQFPAGIGTIVQSPVVAQRLLVLQLRMLLPWAVPLILQARSSAVENEKALACPNCQALAWVPVLAQEPVLVRVLVEHFRAAACGS